MWTIYLKIKGHKIPTSRKIIISSHNISYLTILIQKCADINVFLHVLCYKREIPNFLRKNKLRWEPQQISVVL